VILSYNVKSGEPPKLCPHRDIIGKLSEVKIGGIACDACLYQWEHVSLKKKVDCRYSEILNDKNL